MPNTKNILQRLELLETMGGAMQKEAAMLRQEFQADAQPGTPRKRAKRNGDIRNAAMLRYQLKTKK